MKYLLVALVSLLCISCDRLGFLEEEKEISMSHSPYAYNILNDEKEQVICQGDIEVYNFVSMELSDHGNRRDLLAYSLLMANKYNYGWANYTVYDILKTMNGCEDGCQYDKLNCLDDKTRAMALEYLLLAVESDDKDASADAQVEYDRLKSEGIIE